MFLFFVGSEIVILQAIILKIIFLSLCQGKGTSAFKFWVKFAFVRWWQGLGIYLSIYSLSLVSKLGECKLGNVLKQILIQKLLKKFKYMFRIQLLVFIFKTVAMY